jgi:acetyl esterase/lipase
MTTRRTVLAAAAMTPLLAVIPASAQEATPSTDLGVVYGEVEGEQLFLDVYCPLAREAPHPAVVVLHGGGLLEGGRLDVFAPARALADVGYVVFAPDYRLFRPETGANPWPAQLDDAQQAVRWIRAHAAAYGVDPKRVGAYGHSSGGHLAALLGMRETSDEGDAALASASSRVTCVVDLAGDSDFTVPLTDRNWAAVLAAMLGGTPLEAPEAYRDISPIFHVDGDSAPFLIVHGSQDTSVPVDQSQRLADALQAAEVEVIYAQFPEADHSGVRDWAWHGPFALAFLGRHLRPEE